VIVIKVDGGWATFKLGARNGGKAQVKPPVPVGSVYPLQKQFSQLMLPG